jgi:hypothetical protein
MVANLHIRSKEQKKFTEISLQIFLIVHNHYTFL